MGKIKRVLSIDMDFIGWKSLALYNNLVGESGNNGEAFWDELEETLHIGQFIKLDDAALEFVRKVFEKAIKKADKDNILFVREHDMILELLCADPEKEDEVYELYNIDHHHDIFYSNTQKEHVERFDYAGIGSWVYYLGYHDKIDKYYWINTPYSGKFSDEEMSALDFPVSIESFDSLTKDISDLDFDYVCVCQSPDYLPIMLWDRFYEMIELAKKEKKKEYIVWDEDYCKNGKSRHIARK